MDTRKIRAFRRHLRQFERLNQLSNQACCRGITLSQCHALLEIERLGETTTKQLSENLSLDKSSLSRTIFGLRKLGLIRTAENSSDRRFTMLKLTARGRTKCAGLNKFNDDLYGGIFEKLPVRERDDFLMHFEVLVKAMSEHCTQNGFC